MKHTDDTRCYLAHVASACHRTHVPGMGKDHLGTQRPAADPEGWVMQGHADYCAEYGHAEGGGYGQPHLCARCGDELPRLTTMPTYCDHCQSTAPCNHLGRRAYVATAQHIL